MNRLSGQIKSVESQGDLSLVKIEVGQFELSAIVIDNPDTSPHLTSGNQVKVIFKETEVSIGLDEHARISLQNRLSGTVKAIDNGQLLSKVTLETAVGEIKSIITPRAVNDLGLKVRQTATAYIKTNEIMLSP